MQDWLLRLKPMEAAVWLLGIFLLISAVRSAIRHAKAVASEYATYNGRVYRDYDDWHGNS